MLWPVVVLTAMFVSLFDAQTVRLHDGQRLTINGLLKVEAATRRQEITLATTQEYIPVFKEESSETDGEHLHELGLANYSYAVLYALRGQRVSVSGKMETDSASGYFWHGTRFHIESMRLANGTVINTCKAQAPAPSPSVQTYQATATLFANPELPWRYSPSKYGEIISCTHNAPGDVVNCFCNGDFWPSEAKARVRGKLVPGEIHDLFAQWVAVADEGHRLQPASVIAMTCVRHR